MTYSNASKWANERIPKEDFDSFDEWLQYATTDAPEGLNTPNLLNSSEYIQSMREYWLAEIGTEDRTEEEEIYDNRDIQESAVREINILPKQTITTNRAIVTSGGTPIRIESNTPIRITPIVDTTERRIPQTGTAPTIPKPVYNEPKKSFFSRIKGFFRRK